MKLRIANKILAAVGTEREAAYTPMQISAAVRRIEHTKQHRKLEAYWENLMTKLGPVGRAQVLADLGHPGRAFNLLMRAEW